MTRIFIENNELDLSKGLSNEITYSIDDIKKIDSKTTSYSKTIVLPGTANNNRLLGNIFQFNNANLTNEAAPNVLYNFDASITAAARIEVDGLQIIKGIFRLLEVVEVDGSIEYECAIFGELGGFVSALGNKKIEELDFSAYNQLWRYQNILTSWDNITGAGVYYPLVEYNQESPNGIDFEFTAFRPSFYVKEILEKILTASGYTWDFPFIATNFFKRLVIPNNQLEVSRLSTLAFAATAQVRNYTAADNVRFTVTTLGNFTANVNSDVFTYNSSTALTANITLNVAGIINTISPTSDFTIQLEKNGVAIKTVTYVTPGNGYSFNANLNISNVTINQNDTLEVDMIANLSSVNIQSGSFQINSLTAIRVPVAYDETIIMNDCLPLGVFQRDFFTSIMKMFNLMVTEDKYKEKHLVIKPYKDFYDGTALDWSDKLDRKKTIKIKPMSEINARYYNFKYKQDVDFYNENYFKKFNEGYGDRLYDNNLDFAKDTEVNEIIFASSVLFKTTANDKIYPALYKRSNANTAKDKIATVIRIMQAQKFTGVSSWHIRKEAAGNVSPTLTYYGYAGHLYFGTGLLSTPTIDINFGAPKELQFAPATYPTDNLFNTYYSPYMAEITSKDSRLLTAYFKLTDLDIFNVDFAKFVYIDGGLYRLQKIYDYSPDTNELVKVDLLRVINKTY